MTTEELDRLAELEAKATKGPWRVPVANLFRVIALDGDTPLRGIVEHPDEHFYFGQDDLSYPDGDKHAAADRALIAALRNAAPSLIALARWAEKARTELEKFQEDERIDNVAAGIAFELLSAYPEGE